MLWLLNILFPDFDLTAEPISAPSSCSASAKKWPYLICVNGAKSCKIVKRGWGKYHVSEGKKVILLMSDSDDDVTQISESSAKKKKFSSSERFLSRCRRRRRRREPADLEGKLFFAGDPLSPNKRIIYPAWLGNYCPSVMSFCNPGYLQGYQRTCLCSKCGLLADHTESQYPSACDCLLMLETGQNLDSYTQKKGRGFFCVLLGKVIAANSCPFPLREGNRA